jgi:hypothetical protein
VAIINATTPRVGPVVVGQQTLQMIMAPLEIVRTLLIIIPFHEYIHLLILIIVPEKFTPILPTSSIFRFILFKPFCLLFSFFFSNSWFPAFFF